MQASTSSPVTSLTTSGLNTTSITKSKEQILIQSSGAMIAIIVIGIIIILTVLLLVLKTYNRITHAARMLNGGSSKPRKHTMSTNTNTANVANARANLGIGSFVLAPASTSSSLENGFHLPRVEAGSVELNPGVERFSTTSGSTIVTIHDTPSMENT